MNALRRNVRWSLFVGGAVLLVLAGSYKLWRVLTIPKVPPLHLESAEPEIVRSVNEAAATVRTAPRNSLAWGRLGAILFVHELYGDAAAVFAEAAKLDPRQPRWPYLHAISLADLDPDAGLPLLRRAADLTRESVPAPRCRLAETLLESGQIEEAEQNFRLVLEHFPGNPRALLGLGRIALLRADFPLGIEHLEASAQAASAVAETQNLLATAYQRVGRETDALAAARAASGLPAETDWPDPFLAEIAQFRHGKEADLKEAQRLLDREQWAEVIAYMETRLPKYEDDPRAWRLVGAAWLRQQNYAEAERALRRAIALPPESVDALTQLGMALYHQDAYVYAEGFFRRALVLQPADAGAQFGLGLCLIEGQNWTAAIQAFRAATISRPEWARPYLGLGDALTKNGQAQLAIAPLEQALKLDPRNVQARQLLDRARVSIDAPETVP